MNYRNNWRFPSGLAVEPERPRRVPVRRPFGEPARPPLTGEPGLRPVNRPEPQAPAAVPAIRTVNASEPVQPAPRAAEPGRESQREAGSQAELRAELRAEIDRLRALVDEKDQHAREAAVQARVAGEELERAKQRIRKDADRELEQKKRGVLLSFLEVLDDLDRALDAARTGGHEAQAVVDGVELVRKGFLARLARFDVSPMSTLGERFDPGRHEALSMVPVSEPDSDGLVLGVVREGYTIGDHILRPAAVAVGRYSPRSA